MRSTTKVLRDKCRFLLPLKGKAVVETLHGPAGVEIGGEAILVLRGDSDARRSVELERLAVGGGSLRTDKGESGVITIVGEPSQGLLRFGSRRDDWELAGLCRIHYPELDLEAEAETETGCYYLPKFLPAAVRLTGQIHAVREEQPQGKLRLAVACLAGEGERFTSLVAELDVAWRKLVPLGGDASNEGCNPSLQVNRRRLVVQPVGFRASASDPSPSGSTAAAQIATANSVWMKSCVEIQAQPIHMITNATLKTSSDQTAIRASFTDADPNVIEIFFVQNPLSASGGGNAGAIGVASQKVVVAEPNGGNPVLVAHELGHALGLLHPPSSDAGSVMAPTGSAMNPGTELVSHFMCQNISQPALQTLADTCCLSHDVGDHYIRDFPEDVGNEPSDPLPAGRTRYSMSSVWNRVTHTAGTFGANGPAHEHPYRFEADGVTPKTNFLFARVEQAATLLIRDAVVKFYLKHPGSGGGAANLQLLGQANVVGGVPQNVSLAWQVPAGTPNHSCVFAVVRSPAEPEDDPTALDWVAFEALSRADNDWAQRNLNIRLASPSNLGSGNTFSAAPMVVRIPRAADERHLVFTIDARAAKGLDKAVVEICGRDPQPVPPGEMVEIEHDAEVRDVSLVIRGVVPSGTRAGTGYLFNVEPRLGDVDLVGFTSELRVAPRHDYLAQFVDTLLAACDDLVRATDSTPACQIACRLRRTLSCGCITTEIGAEVAVKSADEFRGIVERLRDRPEAKAFCLESSFEGWETALAGGEPLEIVEGLFGLAQQLQIVAWAILNPPD